MCSAHLIPGIASAQGAERDQSKDAWKRRIRGILDRGRLPIIDLQATYMDATSPGVPPNVLQTAGATDVPRMIEDMNRLDVAQIAFAPAYAANGEPSLKLHRAHPEYFIPTTNSGEFPGWWRGPQAFVSGVAQAVKTGRFFFMGEHEFRHYPSPEQVRSGRSDIERFPGLHFDLAVSAPTHVYQPSGARDAPLFTAAGQLDDRSKAILERYPERFLSSSDYRPAVASQYPEMIRRQRDLLLAPLRDKARHLVAYANAWRLITGSPWSV